MMQSDEYRRNLPCVANYLCSIQAFDCERFDDGEFWLRADYSLRCGTGTEQAGLTAPTAAYNAVRAAAVLAILIYAAGVPLFFLGLLMSCRKQLSRRAPPTPLSAVLGFLSAEYRTRYFAWDVKLQPLAPIRSPIPNLQAPHTDLQPHVRWSRVSRSCSSCPLCGSWWPAR